MRENDCDSCKFCHPDPADSNAGQCRKYAPKPKRVPEVDWEVWASWPMVSYSDWCGEWEAKP